MKLVGPDLGGRLHTARSRNDMGATIDRIRARNFCLRLGTALAGVADAALARAQEFAGYAGNLLKTRVEALVSNRDRVLV